MHYKPTGRDLKLIAPTICIGRGFGKIKPAGKRGLQYADNIRRVLRVASRPQAKARGIIRRA